MSEAGVTAGIVPPPLAPPRRRRTDGPSPLAELSRSSLPSTLLLLLMTVGEREGAEPLGQVIGGLAALKRCLAAECDANALEIRRLEGEAISAVFSAVETLRHGG